LRVVYEIEKRALGSCASNARTNEVLPAPEGAATTYRCPGMVELLSVIAHKIGRDLHKLR